MIQNYGSQPRREDMTHIRMNKSTTNAAIVTGLLGRPKRAPPGMTQI
jgi:hypothetical protein